MTTKGKFSFQAFDEKGKVQFGQFDALNEEDATKHLKDLKYSIIDLAQTLSRDNSKSSLKVSSDELLFFYLQLSTLLGVDIPLLEALEKIQSEPVSSDLHAMLSIIIDKLKKGQSLYISLKQFPSIFKPYVSGLIEAGESSGKLNEVFEELFKMTEYELNMKHEITALVSYPLLLLGSTLIVIGILMVGVYPQFIEIFKEQSFALPLPTLIFFKLSEWIRSYAVYTLIPVGVLIYAVLYIRKFDPASVLFYKTWLLRLPWMGRSLLLFNLRHVFSLLNFLIKNGLPLLDAILLVSKSNKNNYMVTVLGTVIYHLNKGEKMSVAMAQSPFIPSYIISLMGTAEETGRYEEVFLKLSTYLEDIIKIRYRKLLFWLEPVILSLLGLLAALVIASLLLPLFNIIKTVRS